MSKRYLVFGVLLVVALAFSACMDSKADSVREDEGSSSGSTTDKKRDYPLAPRVVAETELKGLDGDKFKIADFKGKVVLINLWATWCAPCIQEMPHFNKLTEKYGDDGFVMVGLNSDDETEAQVKAFVKQQELNYKIAWATEEIIGEFMKISKLPGIPQSLLINREGEMTGLFRGGGPKVIEQMVETVEKMMDEKSN